MELLTDSAKCCTSKDEWMTVRVLEWTSWPGDLYWISFENGSSFTYIFAVWESRLHIKCWLHWSTVLTAMALSIWSSCPVIKLAFVVILTWERARARVCVCILLSLPPPPPPFRSVEIYHQVQQTHTNKLTREGSRSPGSAFRDAGRPGGDVNNHRCRHANSVMDRRSDLWPWHLPTQAKTSISRPAL